ncbi:MAG: tetratricopeptide repeat protein, partial [Leptolyngbyaceae cyanobacterium]
MAVAVPIPFLHGGLFALVPGCDQSGWRLLHRGQPAFPISTQIKRWQLQQPWVAHPIWLVQGAVPIQECSEKFSNTVWGYKLRRGIFRLRCRQSGQGEYMGNGHQLGSFALMLALSGQTPLLAAQRLSSPQVLAQIDPTTVTGQLNETSDTLSDGSYFNVHTFEGTTGEYIRINLVSEAFDTYLILVGPDGNVVAENDDGGYGTNSQLVMTLPVDGTYQVLANSYSTGDTGPYTLTWKLATAADVATVAELQRAEALTGQVVALYQTGRYNEAIPLAEEILVIRREQLGERHPDVATSLNNLAALYQAQGRYGESEHLYQQSLSINREQLGERHPNVATSLNKLAPQNLDKGNNVEN